MPFGRTLERVKQIKSHLSSPSFLLGGVFLCSFLSFALVELFQDQLYFVFSASTYLVFHIIVEFFSIIASFGIFALAWFTYKQSEDNSALFLGCMFLGIGLLDFMHTLSFPGEPAFFTASSTNKGILFWLAARLLFAVTILASAFVPRIMGRFKHWRPVLLTAVLLYAMAVFYAVIAYESVLPAMFLPGVGITPLKIYLEYTVVGMLVFAYVAYLRVYLKRRETVYLRYLAAITISIFSELAFTLYKSAYDTFNMLGHLYKFFAFCAIYAGVFIAAIRRPYIKLSEATIELQKEEVKLKEFDKLKDDFLSVTTHELKTPLVPIKSQAQLLLAGDYGALNKEQKEAVDMIYRNEEALSILADEVLDISRLQSGKLQLVLESAAIGGLVTEVVGDMKSFATQKQITFSLAPIPEMPNVTVDGSRIKQVLRNLLDNAIKFTPEQGTVSIEVGKTGNEIVVQVRDSGIGIKGDDIPKLFVPFFRAESDVTRKYRGTGLGLAVSKGIIESHGGTIRAESDGQSKGSTFTFTLPLALKSSQS